MFTVAIGNAFGLADMGSLFCEGQAFGRFDECLRPLAADPVAAGIRERTARVAPGENHTVVLDFQALTATDTGWFPNPLRNDLTSIRRPSPAGKAPMAQGPAVMSLSGKIAHHRIHRQGECAAAYSITAAQPPLRTMSIFTTVEASTFRSRFL